MSLLIYGDSFSSPHDKCMQHISTSSLSPFSPSSTRAKIFLSTSQPQKRERVQIILVAQSTPVVFRASRGIRAPGGVRALNSNPEWSEHWLGPFLSILSCPSLSCLLSGIPPGRWLPSELIPWKSSPLLFGWGSSLTGIVCSMWRKWGHSLAGTVLELSCIGKG